MWEQRRARSTFEQSPTSKSAHALLEASADPVGLLDSQKGGASRCMGAPDGPAPAPAPQEAAAVDDFVWTVGKVFWSLGLFLAAGLAEIGGGWLVWQAVREGKGWYLALAGSAVLVCYGFIPCAQPVDNFGRVYAVYGGFFVILR